MNISIDEQCQDLRHMVKKKTEQCEPSKQNKWYKMKRVHFFKEMRAIVVFLGKKENHSLEPSFEVDHHLKLKTMWPVKWLPHAVYPSHNHKPDDGVLSHAHMGRPCSVRFSMINQTNHTLESNSVSPSVCLTHSRQPVLSSNLFLLTSVSYHICE